jgi:hypothetical protein
MTSFLDGPAKGQHLLLQRAPQFLRVTTDGQDWDALDVPTDTPLPTEHLYVYKRSDFKGTCHINRGKGRSGFYAIADYRLWEPQPTDAEMRNPEAWRLWCETRP